MKQGELEQPWVLPEMCFYVTQRWEHCIAALAFSIFWVTSIWDWVGSSLGPGVGGKRQGGMHVCCACVPPPCAPPGTHPPAGPVGAGWGSPRRGHTWLAARMFIVTPRAAGTQGELALQPSRAVAGSALMPALCLQPCLRCLPPTHHSQVPFACFLEPESVDVHLLGSQGVVPELSLREKPGFHLSHVLLEHIREERSGCQSRNGPL